MRTGWAIAAVLIGCTGDEKHPCDEGTPTCDSSLVVLIGDPRVDFTLTLKDDQGLDLTVECPLLDTSADLFGDYTVICGAGRLTINTFKHFGDSVEVQLEEAPPRDFVPNYQKGGDFCGNACTNGTIEW